MFKKIDAYLIESADNRYYYSGFHSSAGYVLVLPSERYLFIDARYASEARRNVASNVTVINVTKQTVFEEILKILKKYDVKTIGYEDAFVTVADFKNIKKECDGYVFKPASEEISLERLIKTDEEIARIAEAEVITQKALHKTLPMIKYGVTEKEISAELTYQMLSLGADGLAFDNIVAFGVNTAVPHHKPSYKKLEKGEMVTIDMGAMVNGYCGDMTRSFCVGPPSEKLATIHGIVLGAQEYALANLKAGMTGREAHLLASEYILAHGYGDEFSHSLGHGIGVNVHEGPYLSPNSDEVLKENMVVSVEPGIYVDGYGGARIEDIVVIKNGGVVNLTDFNKNIDIK